MVKQLKVRMVLALFLLCLTRSPTKTGHAQRKLINLGRGKQNLRSAKVSRRMSNSRADWEHAGQFREREHYRK